MRTSSIARRVALLLAACLFSVGVTAAEPVSEPSLAAQEAARQQTQPLNNAPVWKEVRSGDPQVSTVVGRETNVLIQSEGQTWRALRNGRISVYGGWMLVLLFAGVVVYYMIRGTMRLHEPLTGRKLLRFTAVDRLIHWSTAIAFCILAISGLIMFFGKGLLLPLIGYTLFSWLAMLAKNLHNFVGPLFSVCIVLLLINFVRDNFPERGDWMWIKNFGGLFSDAETPSGRFNAGEKLWFWGGACFLGILASVTGFIMDFPNFDQTRQTMQLANMLHSSGAVLFMLGAIGHIYMGTVGMEGAYDAMRTGYVDETWAKEHHAYWYRQVMSERPPSIYPTGGDAQGKPA